MKGSTLGLMLCHRRQDMDRQLVGVRIVDRDEFDSRVHQPGDEGEIA